MIKTYNCAGVTSVKAKRAVLIFSLKKKEACFLNSLKIGAFFIFPPSLMLPRFDIFLFSWKRVVWLNQRTSLPHPAWLIYKKTTLYYITPVLYLLMKWKYWHKKKGRWPLGFVKGWPFQRMIKAYTIVCKWHHGSRTFQWIKEHVERFYEVFEYDLLILRYIIFQQWNPCFQVWIWIFLVFDSLFSPKALSNTSRAFLEKL